MRLAYDQDSYPSQLRHLPDPPRVLTTTGPLERPSRVVAIVGSREALPESEAFAYLLAYKLAQEGVVVVSGGALGVDAAAHRGALAARGVTWCVLPCGRRRCAPSENRRLFQAISVAPGGRLVWPFRDETHADKTTPRYRNGVLMALADAAVVVQAHYRSGSLNAASWARQLGRELWMVPSSPWVTAFCGSNLWLQRGHAKLAGAPSELLTALVGRPMKWTTPSEEASRALEAEGLPVLSLEVPAVHGRTAAAELSLPSSQKKRRRPGPSRGAETADEKAIRSAMSRQPMHLDAIASRARLPVGATVTALLTLALEDVVVEGPDGFFRLQIAG